MGWTDRPTDGLVRPVMRPIRGPRNKIHSDCTADN